jgi:hypothetical protein
MSLEIEDGFNFAVGQWLGELTIALIGLGIGIGVAIVVCSIIGIFEWWDNRRVVRK